MTRYLLDANVFIQAKNLHYGFDFCPAFWEWLVEQNANGVVASIDKVHDEILAGGDELASWAGARGAAFFLPPDGPVLGALTDVSQWVTSQKRRQRPQCGFREAVGQASEPAHLHPHREVLTLHGVGEDFIWSTATTSMSRATPAPNRCDRALELVPPVFRATATGISIHGDREFETRNCELQVVCPQHDAASRFSERRSLGRRDP